MLIQINSKLPDNAALFPPAADRLSCEQRLTFRLADAQRAVAANPVSARANPETFNAELAGFTFDTPLPMDDLIDWSIRSLQTGLVQITHPRYLGLFNPAPSFPAQCADRITASFNPQLASATTSPAAVAIEAHVIAAVAKRAGMPAQSTGHFTSGGSEANATALICALTRAAPDFRTIGSRAFAGQPVFYISVDSHLAWIKIAHQAGIGRLAARMVATDGTGRMSQTALEQAIEADRAAGAVPFMVVATAGTTNAGMVDPLPACNAIARRENLWFHVDAAWGGGLIASDRHRDRLAGLEQADSVTIDAHKWFATTMGCGMFLTVRPEILAEAFSVLTSFMPSHAPEIDPYVTTMQWSRRFLGLRLFFSLAAGGWAGHGAHVERCLLLIQHLSGDLQSLGWTLANDDGSLGVACLLPPEGARPVQEIVAHVLQSGAAWLSAAKFEGRDVIRACVTHGETSPEDIDEVVRALQNARHR